MDRGRRSYHSFLRLFLCGLLLSTGCLDRSSVGCASAADVEKRFAGPKLQALGELPELSSDESAIGALSFHTALVASRAGAEAWVYVDYDGPWAIESQLGPSRAEAGFGASIAIWGNTALVGAPLGGANAKGVVFVFFRGPSGWQEQAILEAPSGAAGDRFGDAIAISGDTAVIGAPGKGAAYVLTRERGEWQLQETLSPPNGAPIPGFGAFAKAWGNEALVGGPADASNGDVHHFVRENGVWRDTGVVDSSTTLGASASARIGDCASATTLNALVTCIREQLPRSGSNGFVAPTAAQQANMRDAVGRMMHGECGFALGEGISGPMQIRSFVDSANGRSYCLLMEVEDADGNGYVDRGWGTVIIDPNATRAIAHLAPHPLYDTGTELEGVDIFKATESRAFLLCGAHRNANSRASACESSYQESDCGHALQTMFQPAVEEMDAFYGQTKHVQIQWHGMATTSCSGVNVYLAEGLSTAPQAMSRLPELGSSTMALHPSWNVDVTGDGTCSLNGTENVQGRFLNGVPLAELCRTSATASTGIFIQIEQQPSYRLATDWIDPIRNTFPASPPAPPSNVVAEAGFQAIRVSWQPPVGVLEGYEIVRAAQAGGPYSTLASGVIGATYTDSGLAVGTPYFYAVKALNFAGESALSSEVSASATSILAPPTEPSATASKKSITLAWTASIGAASYKIERATKSGGPYSVIASGVTTTRYTNSGLSSGKTYYYVITAVNGSTTSVCSEQVSAIPR